MRTQCSSFNKLLRFYRKFFPYKNFRPHPVRSVAWSLLFFQNLLVYTFKKLQTPGFCRAAACNHGIHSVHVGSWKQVLDFFDILLFLIFVAYNQRLQGTQKTQVSSPIPDFSKHMYERNYQLEGGSAAFSKQSHKSVYGETPKDLVLKTRCDVVIQIYAKALSHGQIYFTNLWDSSMCQKKEELCTPYTSGSLTL